MNPPTRVFIIDSDRLSMVTLSLWLDQVQDFEIVGCALQNGNLERRLIDCQPDLVILNIASCGLSGVSTLRRLKATRSDLPVVILHDSDELEGPLTTESEVQLSSTVSLKELVDALKKLGLRSKVVSTNAVLMTKAG